ncbi:ABC transporter ATP-binding protein [Roseomonas sp. CCTCC AB2023176]|uniref:ABC transporter ATP-binding protein n=1 Tax=Roseomonas sp. CCTCC AB2023176 TaxID=3342640 RepID=UPI0035D595DC
MIDLLHVSTGFRQDGHRVEVLSDLTARFDGSADVGILGGNGSGKSTLLRVLAGMIKPDRGVVRRSVRVSPPLSHTGGFHPNLSGRDNARFIARLHGADPAAVIRFARDFSEIGPHFDRPITTYSNSMKARVAYALSMAVPFDMLLVDEVTAVGDVSFKRKCLEAFAERRRNASVIMVSQAVTSIARICSVGAILENGRLTAFPSMTDAVRSYETNLTVLHG